MGDLFPPKRITSGTVDCHLSDNDQTIRRLTEAWPIKYSDNTRNIESIYYLLCWFLTFPFLSWNLFVWNEDGYFAVDMSCTLIHNLQFLSFYFIFFPLCESLNLSRIQYSFMPVEMPMIKVPWLIKKQLLIIFLLIWVFTFLPFMLILGYAFWFWFFLYFISGNCILGSNRNFDLWHFLQDIDTYRYSVVQSILNLMHAAMLGIITFRNCATLFQ